jgi:predicted ribonuclease YlaK
MYMPGQRKSRRSRLKQMPQQPRKSISGDQLLNIKALTQNQGLVVRAWEQDMNLVLHGAAGTGKTFLSLYLALKDVLSAKTVYDQVCIVRSLVPTREIGFLPGTLEEKSAVYEMPYKTMVKDMFDVWEELAMDSLYDSLKANDVISFWSTSYLRGTTLDNSIILVDEFSNMNFHELDSIITRVGQDSKIIFCGDINQSDLVKLNEKTGIQDFMGILNRMPEFETVEFGIEDIVRSGLVYSYLVTKTRSGL